MPVVPEVGSAVGSSDGSWLGLSDGSCVGSIQAHTHKKYPDVWAVATPHNYLPRVGSCVGASLGTCVGRVGDYTMDK
jgi:hypothetical protein